MAGGGSTDSAVELVTTEAIACGTIAFVLLLQALFDWIERLLVHHKHAEDMLRSMYKELMILGLVALLLFALDTGGLVNLATKHALEVVHLTVFVVALFYAVFVAALVGLSLNISRQWRNIEDRDFTEWQSSKQEFAQLSAELSRMRCWPLYLWAWAPRKLRRYLDLEEMVKFHELKFRFTSVNDVGEEFTLVTYLKKAKQHVFLELVSIPEKMWVAALAFIAVDLYFRGVFSSYKDFGSLAWWLIGLSAFVSLSCLALYLKIRNVYWVIAHSEVVAIDHAASQRAENWDAVLSQLDHDLAESPSGSDKASPGQPSSPKQSRFHQADLFWFGRPKLMIHFMQAIVFVAAVNLGMALQFRQSLPSGFIRVVVALSLVCSVVLLFVFLHKVVPLYVLSTHTGEMVDDDLLAIAKEKCAARRQKETIQREASLIIERRRSQSESLLLKGSLPPVPPSTTPPPHPGADMPSTDYHVDTDDTGMESPNEMVPHNMSLPLVAAAGALETMVEVPSEDETPHPTPQLTATSAAEGGAGVVPEMALDPDAVTVVVEAEAEAEVGVQAPRQESHISASGEDESASSLEEELPGPPAPGHHRPLVVPPGSGRTGGGPLLSDHRPSPLRRSVVLDSPTSSGRSSPTSGPPSTDSRPPTAPQPTASQGQPQSHAATSTPTATPTSSLPPRRMSRRASRRMSRARRFQYTSDHETDGRSDLETDEEVTIRVAGSHDATAAMVRRESSTDRILRSFSKSVVDDLMQTNAGPADGAEPHTDSSDHTRQLAEQLTRKLRKHLHRATSSGRGRHPPQTPSPSGGPPLHITTPKTPPVPATTAAATAAAPAKATPVGSGSVAADAPSPGTLSPTSPDLRHVSSRKELLAKDKLANGSQGVSHKTLVGNATPSSTVATSKSTKHFDMLRSGKEAAGVGSGGGSGGAALSTVKDNTASPVSQPGATGLVDVPALENVAFLGGLRGRLAEILVSAGFHDLVLALVFLAFFSVSLIANDRVSSGTRATMETILQVSIGGMVIELILKLYTLRWELFLRYSLKRDTEDMASSEEDNPPDSPSAPADSGAAAPPLSPRSLGGSDSSTDGYVTHIRWWNGFDVGVVVLTTLFVEMYATWAKFPIWPAGLIVLRLARALSLLRFIGWEEEEEVEELDDDQRRDRLRQQAEDEAHGHTDTASHFVFHSSLFAQALLREQAHAHELEEQLEAGGDTMASLPIRRHHHHPSLDNIRRPRSLTATTLSKRNAARRKQRETTTEAHPSWLDSHQLSSFVADHEQELIDAAYAHPVNRTRRSRTAVTRPSRSMDGGVGGGGGGVGGGGGGGGSAFKTPTTSDLSDISDGEYGGSSAGVFGGTRYRSRSTATRPTRRLTSPAIPATRSAGAAVGGDGGVGAGGSSTPTSTGPDLPETKMHDDGDGSVGSGGRVALTTPMSAPAGGGGGVRSTTSDSDVIAPLSGELGTDPPRPHSASRIGDDGMDGGYERGWLRREAGLLDLSASEPPRTRVRSRTMFLIGPKKG